MSKTDQQEKLVTVENIQKGVFFSATIIRRKSRRRNNVAVERQLGTTLSGGESRMKQAAGWLRRADQLCTITPRVDPCRVHAKGRWIA